MLNIKHTNTDIYLKSILNILTEAYDYVRLTEAVPYSKAKEYLQIERSPEAEARIKEVFNKLKSLPNAHQLDKRGYRIAFPYAEDSTEFEIQSILEPYNFSIKDYKNGVALDTKNNREISLNKALTIVSKKEPDAKELIDRYADIKSKGATSKDEDLMMVFSSAKYDIIGMSTGREWDSCMNVIEGGNRHYVKLDIKEGSIICYLTTVNDTDLKKPLGRILIKPYINTENREDVVLYAELRTYGSIPNPEKFMNVIDDYMEKTQNLSGVYKRLGCLYKDSQRGEIEGKEIIRTRALKKLEDGKELEDSEFVALPLKYKRRYINILVQKNTRLYDFQYTFASQSQKREYIRKILYNGQFIEDFEFKGAPKDIKSEIISKKLEYKNPLEQYELEAATPEQKEESIDIKLNNGEYLEYYELEAATPEQKEKYINIRINSRIELDNHEFEAATPKQKEKYINIRINNREKLDDHEFEAATPEQIERYIDVLIDIQYNLRGNELKAATTKQKEKYIDIKLSLERSLQKYEFQAATSEQKEKYINWKLSDNYELKDYELEAATPEQIEKYIDGLIDIQDNLRGYELKAATNKQKEKYINIKLSLKRSLQEYEFKAATSEQKERYINWKLSDNYELKDYELEAATKEQKERYQEYAKY